MRTLSNHHVRGSFLLWYGLLAVVVAIMAGIMGMHVVTGMPSTHMANAGISSAMVVDSVTAHPTNHHVPSPIVTRTGVDALGQKYTAHECSCSPMDCTSAMSMHGDCTPTISSTVLNVSLPGLLTTHAAGTVYLAIPGHKAADRAPDTPSLEQLSISRT